MNPHEWHSFDGEGSRLYEPDCLERAQREVIERFYRNRINRALEWAAKAREQNDSWRDLTRPT